MANLRIKGDVSGYVDLVSPDVAGSTTIALDKIVVTDASGSIEIGNSSSTFSQQIIRSSTTGIGELRFGDDIANAGYLKYDHNSNQMIFATNATAQMYISSNGNVGIGTASPSGKLEVGGGSGSTGVQSYFSVTAGYTDPAAGNASHPGGAKIILWNDTNTPQKASIGMSGNADIWFNNAGSQAGAGFTFYTGNGASATPEARLKITKEGNVGIGTTGPASTLEVYKSGTTRAYIGNTNNGHVFMSQSDVGYDGFQVYQQHGTNQDRNSFSVQDNRTGSKSPAFGVRGDGTVFVGRGAGSNNNQTSFNIGRGQTWPNMLHYMDLGGGSNHVNSTTSQYKIRMQIHRNEMYYKNVMVELFADSGYDWGGHGFCQYYGKFLVSFRDTTAHSIHVLENTGYNFLQGTGVYSYNGTSGFYDTNYYYVDFQFGSNQGGTPGFRPNFSAIGYQNHQLIYAIGVIN